MGAVMLMPAFGVAVDQLARLGAAGAVGGAARVAGRDGDELGALQSNGDDWASARRRRTQRCSN